jgi:THUMP domain-like
LSAVVPADVRRPVGFVHIIPRPNPIATPILSAFAMRDVSTLDLKHLRRMIPRQNVGALETKVRGVDATPEFLRAQLKPRGEERRRS